jgi:alanyl-tRNA synthetase
LYLPSCLSHSYVQVSRTIARLPFAFCPTPCYRERGHAVLPLDSLVPQNDPTVLFTTAGMHPLVPYLLREPHPLGRRLTNVQKCLRTHGTFFEMLGFWSLGDYWQRDSLRWTLEWFTEGVGLARDRIYVTVFAGDDDAPRNEGAATIWGGPHLFLMSPCHS